MSGEIFFLHGAGGTGKTFLYNTLCYHLRSQDKIVLCVASSGIDSLLLQGGCTAHSCFKIPIPFYESSVCNILKLLSWQSWFTLLTWSFGMRPLCSITITWRQWIALSETSLTTLKSLLVVLVLSLVKTLSKSCLLSLRGLEVRLWVFAFSTPSFGLPSRSFNFTKTCNSTPL